MQTADRQWRVFLAVLQAPRTGRTLGQLEAELKVDGETLHHDLDRLILAGFPIVVETFGGEGHVSIDRVGRPTFAGLQSELDDLQAELVARVFEETRR